MVKSERYELSRCYDNFGVRKFFFAFEPGIYSRQNQSGDKSPQSQIRAILQEILPVNSYNDFIDPGKEIRNYMVSDYGSKAPTTGLWVAPC